MVLKSAKGIYMQLDSGKIIAIRTTSKRTECDNKDTNKDDVIDITSDCDTDNPKPKTSEPGKDNKTFGIESIFKFNLILDKPIEKTTEKPSNGVTTKECPKSDPPETTAFVATGTVGEVQQPKPPILQIPQIPQTPQTNNQNQSVESNPTNLHPMTENLEYQKQQPYKHEAQLPTAQPYNSSINVQPNTSHAQTIIPNNEFTENSYFSSKNVQHTFPPQYYNYYDNKSTPTTPANYHLNNYTPYGHFNFAPYHSNFHTAPGYSGSSAAYINSNVFPRQPWSSVANHQTSNESIRQQQYMGNTYPINEWSSQ